MIFTYLKWCLKFYYHLFNKLRDKFALVRHLGRFVDHVVDCSTFVSLPVIKNPCTIKPATCTPHIFILILTSGLWRDTSLVLSKLIGKYILSTKFDEARWLRLEFGLSWILFIVLYREKQLGVLFNILWFTS